MGNKSALIIGATGLVGNELTQRILSSDDYSQINIISRSKTTFDDYRITETNDDFENLSQHPEQFNVDDVFCCIGTTMKKAGSKEKFVRIDYHYPMEIARLSLKEPSVKNFLIVTAVGANPDSSIFYNQVKGELERDLQKLDFKSLHIFRPSLLLGDRNEFRIWESVAKAFSAFLSFFLIGSEKKIWAIQSEKVAEAMHNVAREGKQGTYFYEPAKIRSLTKS
ncbi:MAG: oxidoreductase [Cyclobacteriaceae bacterium]